MVKISRNWIFRKFCHFFDILVNFSAKRPVLKFKTVWTEKAISPLSIKPKKTVWNQKWPPQEGSALLTTWWLLKWPLVAKGLTEKREIPFVCNNEGHTANKEEDIFHEFFYEHNRFSPSNAYCSRRCSEHLQVEG